jgi:hypothetical protein
MRRDDIKLQEKFLYPMYAVNTFYKVIITYLQYKIFGKSNMIIGEGNIFVEGAPFDALIYKYFYSHIDHCIRSIRCKILNIIDKIIPIMLPRARCTISMQGFKSHGIL